MKSVLRDLLWLTGKNKVEKENYMIYAQMLQELPWDLLVNNFSSLASVWRTDKPNTKRGV